MSSPPSPSSEPRSSAGSSAASTPLQHTPVQAPQSPLAHLLRFLSPQHSAASATPSPALSAASAPASPAAQGGSGLLQRTHSDPYSAKHGASPSPSSHPLKLFRSRSLEPAPLHLPAAAMQGALDAHAPPLHRSTPAGSRSLQQQHKQPQAPPHAQPIPDAERESPPAYRKNSFLELLCKQDSFIGVGND